MARPSAIARPEVVDNFLSALKAGNHVHVAADFAGIDQSTISGWIRRGARELTRAFTEAEKKDWKKPRFIKKEAVYARFAQSVQQATAQAEVRLSTAVATEAQTNWVAAMTLLERRWPERWSRLQRNEVTGGGGGAIAIDVSSRREAMEEIEAEWEEERESSGELQEGRKRVREGDLRTDSKIEKVDPPDFTEQELQETEE